MANYNIKFDWNRISTLGKVRILVEQVVGQPSQDAISQAVADYIDSHPGALSPLSAATKSALLQIAQKVAYIDENGQDYYDALDAALNAKALLSITAVYTQSGTVYDTDSLDSLKSDLVVTAYYDDGTSADVTSASVLSGTLAEGTSVITAEYSEKTSTFNVTVSVANPLLYNWDYTTSLTDTVGGVTSVLVNGVTQTSAGLVISASNHSVVVGKDILGFDKTIEVDVYGDGYAAGNNTAVLWQLWNGTDDPPSGYYSTFGYHYSGTAANNKVGAITTAVGHWGYSSYARTFLNGKSATLKMTISSTGMYKYYLDGVDMNIQYDGEDMYIDSADNIKAMTIGYHANGSYVTFYGLTVKAVRIYDGVR